MKASAGFTLVELLIVITVISVLATIGYISYASIQKDARDQKRLSNLKLIEQTLEHIRSTKGRYPAGSNAEPSSVTEITTVMNPIPTDPSPGGLFKYNALPEGCDNSIVTCSDYVLCAQEEGSKQYPQATVCNTLSCSSSDSSIRCKIGITAQ